MEYFSTSQRRDYLYNSKKINIEYVGCAVGYTRVTGDKEDNGEAGGCLASSSEDGLSYWFMMSNCKRAQVVFNVFASSGIGGCSEGTFQESVSFRMVAEILRLRSVGPRTHSTSCALLCCHCRKADLTPFTTLTPLPSPLSFDLSLFKTGYNSRWNIRVRRNNGSIRSILTIVPGLDR